MVEEYTFSSALESANGQGVNTVPVTMDEFGIIPEKLEELMSRWVGNKTKILVYHLYWTKPYWILIKCREENKFMTLPVIRFLDHRRRALSLLQMETYTKDKAAREGKAVHDHDEFLKALFLLFISLMSKVEL